jgi:tryptophan synthase alpha chain
MNVESYKEMFERVKSKKEGAFIPFVVAGDPNFDISLEIVKLMVENGADALEIGFPFSDPVADGSTIQSADIRALDAGMTTERGFEFIEMVRKFTSIPIGLLTYYNLIYKMGIERFYMKTKESGVNAVLAADLPPEEAGEAVMAAKSNGVQQIFMVAQTTTNQRLHKIEKMGSGFLYVVSVMGITGARSKLKTNTIKLIERMNSHSKHPICVGFGILKPEHVRQIINAGADGAIVASALIDIIAVNLHQKETMNKKIGDLCRKMKEATRMKVIK